MKVRKRKIKISIALLISSQCINVELSCELFALVAVVTHMAMKNEVILVLSSEHLLVLVTEDSLRHAHFIFDFR